MGILDRFFNPEKKAMEDWFKRLSQQEQDLNSRAQNLNETEIVVNRLQNQARENSFILEEEIRRKKEELHALSVRQTNDVYVTEAELDKIISGLQWLPNANKDEMVWNLMEQFMEIPFVTKKIPLKIYEEENEKAVLEGK